MKTRYKFLREGLKSDSGNHTWEIGKWYAIEGELDICNNGFHCSKEMWQAFSYVQGELLAEVEVKGKSIVQNNKEAWTEMRVIKVWKWQKKDSVALSIYSAELCISEFEKMYPEDKRPREAIEAAKKWIIEPTEKNKSAARSAAWSAARSAAWSAAWSAWSAESAAWSAARSARSATWSARSAAESAAWSARSAAESAARGKVFKTICKWFDSHLSNLETYE